MKADGDVTLFAYGGIRTHGPEEGGRDGEERDGTVAALAGAVPAFIPPPINGPKGCTYGVGGYTLMLVLGIVDALLDTMDAWGIGTVCETDCATTAACTLAAIIWCAACAADAAITAA